MLLTIYSKPNCPYCDQAKALAKQQGLAFEEIILDVGQPKAITSKYIAREELLAKIPTARTMPQIVLDNEYIGGFTELKARLS